MIGKTCPGENTSHNRHDPLQVEWLVSQKTYNDPMHGSDDYGGPLSSWTWEKTVLYFLVLSVLKYIHT